MKLILQPKGSSLCGQCCIAMLLDITIEEAIRLVGHDGISSNEDLLNVLETKYPNVKTNEFYGRIKNRNYKVKKSRTYLCKHRNPKKEEQEHWTICYQGVIMDPSGREKKDLWPMYKYWIIK